MRAFALSSWLFLFACVVHGQSVDTLTVELEDGSRVPLGSQMQEAKIPSALPATREYSSENIKVRKFDPKKWHDIVDSRDYADTRTRKNPQDKQGQGEGGRSSGTRGGDTDENDDGRYEYDRDEGSSLNLSWLGPLGQIIFYVAIAVIIIVILQQIIRNTSFRSNPKRPSASSNSVDNVHDITALETEDLIQKAHGARDYKLAVRLYFLDLLKKLNENGVIVWTKDKTNRDYLSELLSKQYYFDEVRKLTLAYERVWYGEHLPTEEGYLQLRNEFQEINQKFKTS
jgi:hypothetical protein